MELIEANEQMAKEILTSGKRSIKAIKGEETYSVKWINTNNSTCGISRGGAHEATANNEDLKFFISVPKNAKTVY